MVDRSFTDTIVYANEMLPAELVAQVRAMPVASASEQLAFVREALARFDDPDGRVRYVIAPSGNARAKTAGRLEPGPYRLTARPDSGAAASVIFTVKKADHRSRTAASAQRWRRIL